MAGQVHSDDSPASSSSIQQSAAQQPAFQKRDLCVKQPLWDFFPFPTSLSTQVRGYVNLLASTTNTELCVPQIS